MSILQELLELLNPPDEMLVEFLGNLAFIQKKFVPILKHSGKREWQRYSSKDIFKKQKGFSGFLGQDSVVKESTVKTAADIDKLMKEENFMLVVLQIENEQIAMIRKHHWSSAAPDGSEPAEYKYEFFVDIDLLDEHTTEESEVKFHSITQKAKFIGNQYWENLETTKPLTEKGAYSEAGNLLKCIKETDFAGKPMTAHAVFKDTRRLVTAKDRKDARDIDVEANKILLKTRPGREDLEDSFYNKWAKDYLNLRLQEYKLTKVGNLESIQDLIDLVKEKGFQKFIKIKGQSYKMEGLSNMSLDSFTDTSTRYKPYVEYDVDEDTPAWEAAKKKGRALKDLFDVDTKEGEEEYWAEYRKMMPPRRIKLELKLGPGGIVVKGPLPLEQY